MRASGLRQTFGPARLLSLRVMAIELHSDSGSAALRWARGDTLEKVDKDTRIGLAASSNEGHSRSRRG
jgi:hypothetical protein